MPDLHADVVATCCFPNAPLTIVPLALGLATVMRSAADAILLAANVGGDSDSVASIAGGILGAIHPATVNPDWFEIVQCVNGDSLAAVAQGPGPRQLRPPGRKAICTHRLRWGASRQA